MEMLSLQDYSNIRAYKEERCKNLYSLDLFDNQTVFNKKLASIENYFVSNDIRKVVVGFSGGADSVMVLLLLVLVARRYPLEIHAVTIVSDNDLESCLDKQHYKNILRLPLFSKVIKRTLNYNHQNSIKDVFTAEELTPEVIHQSYYQSMYGLLFTYAQFQRAITVGTTNSDELSYVGWFGKNSDMVVDLQIISDLHKFEINHFLKEFNLDVVINKEPTGDIPGGKSDTEYFECDYDTLAYYSYCRCNHVYPGFNLPGVDRLHYKNFHKYLGQGFNPIFLVDKERFHIYKTLGSDYAT